jgi:hypothetical protein
VTLTRLWLPHPEQKDRSLFAVLAAERSSLIPYPGRFDGFHEAQVAVSKSSPRRPLKRAPRRGAGASTTTATAWRSRRHAATPSCGPPPTGPVIWHDGEIVAEHPRRFGRGQTSYNP